MKKRLLIEFCMFTIALIIYILVLSFKKNLSDFDYYLEFILFSGLIFPLFHLIGILIYELNDKTYLSKRYDSVMTYSVILISGFVYIVTKYTLNTFFDKIKYLMWVIPLLIYITCITLGVILQKKDDKKNKNIKIKNNKLN